MDFLRSLFVSVLSEWTHDRHAAHANRRTQGEPHPTTVTFGWGSKLLGVIVCSLVVPIAMLTVFGAVTGHLAEGKWIAAPLFGGVAIWLSLIAYDQFVRLIEWNESGVRFRKWNGERFVPWSDIASIEDKDHPPHVRIGFRDGTGFAVSETMLNSRYFLALLERRLDPDPDGHAPRSKRRKRRRRGKSARPDASQA